MHTLDNGNRQVRHSRFCKLIVIEDWYRQEKYCKKWNDNAEVMAENSSWILYYRGEIIFFFLPVREKEFSNISFEFYDDISLVVYL